MFEVPASKASIGQNLFEFKIGAKKYSVKKAKYLTIDQLVTLQSDTLASLDFFGDPKTAQGKAVRSLDREQFTALVEAWNDDSEVSSGESPASES